MDTKPSSRDRVWGSQVLQSCVLVCKATAPLRLPQEHRAFFLLRELTAGIQRR